MHAGLCVGCDKWSPYLSRDMLCRKCRRHSGIWRAIWREEDRCGQYGEEGVI